MSFQLNGELVPVGGGDTIPLIRESMTLGRRESCDICLQFPNVSGLHAELIFRNGFWYIRDRNSKNGVKVNGMRVQEKVLQPKDEITIAKRRLVIQYEMPAGAQLPEEAKEENIMGRSLLEKAGLVEPPHEGKRDPKSRAKGFDPAEFLLEDEE